MKILSNEIAQNYQINSLQRGHLVFTSFISHCGKIVFLESHIERLVRGADFLFPSCGWLQNQEKIKQYVEAELKNAIDYVQNSFYFRLTIFDECIYLEKRELEIFSDSLKLLSALKVKTIGLLPSYLKVSNYLESDLELIRAKLKNYEDVLFFDKLQNVTEASSSNIFIVTKENQIITPAPSSIILDGITRNKLLEKLQVMGLNILEAPITKADLEDAREIWLTNSVKGVRFVLQFEDVVYDKNGSLFEKVIASFGRYGELV
jgi:branched-subunit amino acid aminotransferase/4-amino-4-deoxychorismate lyase